LGGGGSNFPLSHWLSSSLLQHSRTTVRVCDWTSNVEHIVSCTAIFDNICTAHALIGLFMNVRCKSRHRRSICRPQFPVRVQNFGDLATFSVDFCISYAECPPYFYIRFVWPTDLESIPHAKTHTSIIATKFEDPTLIRSCVNNNNICCFINLVP